MVDPVKPTPTQRSGKSDALVLLATATDAWEVDEDATPLVDALARVGVRGEPARWDDPGVDWEGADLVVVRSTWDYALRRDEFLAWTERVAAATSLANPAGVLRWNTDKTYLRDLVADGLHVVATEFVAPTGTEADLLAAISRVGRDAVEFVVKPSVSAGSKDTGRFTHAETPSAVDLGRRIRATGRTVMVQPYLRTVDDVGETGLVYFEGEFSHAFEKGPLLSPGGETAHGLFALERIRPRTASPAERDLGDRVLSRTTDRLGAPLLYARVDLLTDDDGDPVLLELELAEPSWFLTTDPGAADRAAAAIRSALR